MPAFTAIGAYVAGTIFGLAGTAALVVGTLVATGAAYITSRIINGNPNKGNNSAQGSQGGRIQVPPATNNKIPVVYGNSFVNGIITDARLISTDQKINDTMYYCIVLSETCNNETAAYTIDNVYWNDLRLVFSGTDPYKVIEGRKNVDNPDGVTEDFVDTNFVVDNKNLVEVRVYAGGSAAANQIFPTSGTTPAYTYWAGNDGSWDIDYAMKGLIFAIVKVTYNGEKGFTGLPNMTFQLNNTISNPADVWYDYMTGERYGAGIDPSYIDTTAQTAWKNFCDEDITYTDKDGNTNQSFARYAINGPIDTSRSVKENIDIIMQNAGAWLSYNVSTGLWSPIIKKAVTAGEIGMPLTYFTASRSTNELTVTNFPAGRIEAGQLLYNSSGTLIGTILSQVTPTAGQTAGQKGKYITSTSGSISSTTFYTLPATMLAFSDDNIISGITISSTRLDDLYNQVEAEFYDKHNKDQRAYARNEIDAGDRNPNEPNNQLRLSLDLCNNSMQADLLGQLELRQSRDDLVVEFTTNHYGIQAQAGDVVSITSALYDWNPKYFRVMRVKEQETEEGGLVAQIQGLEYNPDVYTIEPLTEFSTSANIGIGVYAASPNLPQPPVVEIIQVDTDVAIPNFQLQIKIPTDGGPYDEIELYYTEGWDPMSITGTIVPGTGSNGAPVGDGLLTVTAIDYGALNVGDYFTVGSTSFTVTSQLTNTPASKTFASGGAPFANTVTLNNTTGLLIGNNLKGTGLPTTGSHITAIAGSQVTLDKAFDTQAAGTYTVEGGLGTYVVDTSATLSGTTTLYDLPVDSDYVYLKKHTPDGNNPTFTNGESITIVITEVPANTQTYRRWFVKARMGIKKRFGKFSTPTITDKNGNFRYTPNPVASGTLGDLSDVSITSANEGQTLYYDATISKWKNNSILEVDDSSTFGGIVVGEGITQPMITFTTQADGVNPVYGIRGKSSADDAWFVGSGSAGDDQGYIEIATGDNAGESNNGGQIYVRQYSGSGGANVPWYGGTGTVQRELILLDNLGNTTIPQNLTVDSGTLFVNATTKKVGINDTSPSYALDVTGEIAQTGENLRLNTDDSGADVTVHFNSGRNIKWDHDNQRFELNANTYISDDLTVDGGNINLNGTAQAGVKPFLTFATQADGANSMYGIRGMSTVDDPWFVGAGSTGDDGGYLEIATGDNAGGTNSGGQIYVRQYSGQDSGGAPWYGGSGTVQRTLILLDNIGYTSIPLRLGINNTSPTVALDVTGSAYINENLTVHGSTYLGNNYITDVTHVTGEFKVTNNSVDNLFVDHTTGYVGINNTSPSTHLDIAGGLLAVTSVSGERPRFQYDNTAAGINSAIFLRKNYTNGSNTGAFTTGDGVGIGFQLDSDTQAVNQIGLISTKWDASAPVISLSTNINNNTGGPFLDAATFSTADTILTGNLTVTGNNIKKSGGTTVITFSGTNLTTFAGDIAIGGNTIRDSASTAAIELSGANVTVEGTLSVKGTTLSLNSDGTGTEDVIISFERGASDATIKWNETTTDRFEFNRPITTENGYGVRVSQDLYGTGYHGTVLAGTDGSVYTGGNYYFQRNGGTYPSNNASIYVDRAGGATDSYITWTESTTSWDISNDVTVAEDLTVAGNLTLNGNTIKANGGTTAITINGDDVRIADALILGGDRILSSGGSTVAITLSGNDVIIADQLTVTGNTIKSNSATAITLSGANVTVAGDLTVTNNTIKSNTATAITLSGDDVTVAGDLTVTNNTIKSNTATAITLSGDAITVPGTITSSVNTGSSFFNKVGCAADAAADTEVVMDNLKIRLHTTSGSNLRVEARAVSSSFAGEITMINNVAGTAIYGENNSNTYPTTVWTAIGSSSVLASFGDMITAHIYDNTNQRIYRVTTFRGPAISPGTGHISIERLV